MAISTDIFIPGSAGLAKYLNTILSGKSVPPSEVGSVGDFWLDTRPGVYVLYGPKQGANWPAQGQSLIGEGGGTGGGLRFIFGEGPPSDDLGQQPNDVYFDKTNALIYQAS